jgi:hypothetical protein
MNSVLEGIRSKDFFILPLFYRYLSSASRLILKSVGSRGHFQSLVVLFNDTKDRIKVDPTPLNSHKPRLETTDFEKYVAKIGKYTITLVRDAMKALGLPHRKWEYICCLSNACLPLNVSS